MILIAILDHNAYLLKNIPPNLQLTDFTATTALDGKNLSAWLVTHGVDMLARPLPIENKRSLTTAISTKPEKPNSNKQTSWQLNSSQLELITPFGSSILLSHNEYSALGAAANANGNLVSRLRRKLASYAPENFSIRGVKGPGSLFGVALQILETF